MESWSCYVYRTNRLLGQENFYSPTRVGKSSSSSALGAAWLLACLATPDRLYGTQYSTQRDRPNDSPVIRLPHGKV
jgi:hypothetical protein